MMVLPGERSKLTLHTCPALNGATDIFAGSQVPFVEGGLSEREMKGNR